MTTIAFFDNVFDEQFCRFLLANARASLETGTEFTRSNFHWDERIRKSSAPVLVRDYDDVLARLILDRLLARGLIPDADYRVMNYAWTRLSYIPWHTDAKQQGVTVYLNERWELDWGGLFLFKDELGDIRAVPPNFNYAVRNDNSVPHATTPVSLDAPEPRFTLQLFDRAAA